MRKVFLDDLPRKGKLIDWKGSVGRKIRFIYEDIEDEVVILSYEKENGKLLIEYRNRTLNIATGHFSKCKLGKLLGRITNEFKFGIGQMFEDEKRNITITDRECRKARNGTVWKLYKYTCNKCGWTEGWIEEGALKRGQGCSCCRGLTTVLGINTIWDTDRWMCDLGISEEDAKRHTKCSGDIIEVSCLHCGNKKELKISDIYRNKSIGCICGDGVSFNEKFIYNLLTQLNVNFLCQLSKSTFEWCDNYKYDFYLPDYKYIVEVNGMQHYKNVKTWNVNVEAIKKNDESKKIKAVKNGIKEYIILDCRYSELDWIKNNILNSKLFNVIDLSRVNWEDCEKFALSNLLMRVCEYWNNKDYDENVNDLANKFNISNTTVRDYLNRGTKYGFCNYNPEEETRKGIIKSNKSKSQRIEVFKDNISIGIFETVRYLLENSREIFGIQFTQVGISISCRKGYRHKGFTFKYLNK